MTERTILTCDEVDCGNSISAYPVPGTPEAVERAKWVQDDFGNDRCPTCVEANRIYEEGMASGEEVEALAQGLEEATPPDPLASVLGPLTQQEFEKMLAKEARLMQLDGVPASSVNAFIKRARDARAAYKKA